MADNTEKERPVSCEPEKEGGDEITPRGNEWEVVSLTASTYAASPGPKGPDSIHEEKGSARAENEAETSQALFMSGHFAFAPSQHENPAIEEEVQEMHTEEKEGERVVGEMQIEEGDRFQPKDSDNFIFPGLNVPEDFPISQVFDGKADSLSIHESKFDEMTLLHEAKSVDVNQVMFDSAKNSEMNLGSASLQNFIEPSESSLEPLVSQSENSPKDDKNDSDNLPSGAWWERPVACIRAHVTETNAFWSIFIAAAVMGLVILGQKWQQEKRQVLQQRSQFTLSSEKSGRAVGSSSAPFKDIIVGGSQHASYISSGVSANHGR